MEKRDLITLLILIFVLSNLIFLFSYKSVLYNKNFYEKQFNKQGVYAEYNKTFVNDEHDGIMKFLLTKKSSTGSESLSQQDILHLNDVKKILRSVNYYSYFIVGIIGLLFLYLHYIHKRIIDKFLAKAVWISGIINATMILILYLFSRNFDWFFIKFHKILFSNDLWLMDPKTNLLVNLYPDLFWQEMFMRIIVITLIVSAVFVVVGIIGEKVIKKHNMQKKES